MVEVFYKYVRFNIDKDITESFIINKIKLTKNKEIFFKKEQIIYQVYMTQLYAFEKRFHTK